MLFRTPITIIDANRYLLLANQRGPAAELYVMHSKKGKGGHEMSWADDLFEKTEARGTACSVTRRVNGWPETMTLKGKTYYVKSMSYIAGRKLYFQGVDPRKLSEKGDYVLLCGRRNNKLVDIFIIPWEVFFETLRQGEPTNTYKLPKVYLQYKFYVRDRSDGWLMTVQGGKRPRIDVSKCRYDASEAIEQLGTTGGKTE